MGGEVSVLSSCPRCGAVRSIAGGPARGDLGDGVLDLGARDHVGVTAATGQHPRCMLAALTPPGLAALGGAFFFGKGGNGGNVWSYFTNISKLSATCRVFCQS